MSLAMCSSVVRAFLLNMLAGKTGKVALDVLFGKEDDMGGYVSTTTPPPPPPVPA